MDYLQQKPFFFLYALLWQTLGEGSAHVPARKSLKTHHEKL